VLTVAITISMITACLLGVLMPTLLRVIKADPKIAAGPLVLAMTDLATLLFYFNLAGVLLS
jgi:magnesium transporter